MTLERKCRRDAEKVKGLGGDGYSLVVARYYASCLIPGVLEPHV